MIAEGERAGRLKENGCLINGQVYRPEVWTPKEAHGADLLIVSLKYGALPGALDSIAQVVGEHTIVMSLMNGVDSEEIIAQKVNPDNILHALIKVASHKEENGYCFNPERQSVSSSGKSSRRLRVNVYRRCAHFLKMRRYISV